MSSQKSSAWRLELWNKVDVCRYPRDEEITVWNYVAAVCSADVAAPQWSPTVPGPSRRNSTEALLAQ